MRLVITFFLSLFFLLPGGYDHLYAICYTTAKPAAKAEQATLSASKSSHFLIKKATSSDVENEAVNATEREDDDELPSERKLVEINNYFISFFYTHSHGYFHSYLKDRLPFCKHFSYTSSGKYIVQRAIRVWCWKTLANIEKLTALLFLLPATQPFYMLVVRVIIPLKKELSGNWIALEA